MSIDNELTYDIVVATRNRPEALALTIPRMLNQNRRPARLIVVDSSDDHRAVANAVDRAVGDDPIFCEVMHTERGSSIQRNIGMNCVTAPITYFPDDDSVWYEGVAAAILDIYESDVDEHIGAVCGIECPNPPENFAAGGPAYRRGYKHALLRIMRRPRAFIERALAPDPLVMHGRLASERLPQPGWLDSKNAAIVEYMTGFRMTFRSELIRKITFDPTLQNYGLCEDVDASFGVLATHLVVGAHDALIYHHKYPGSRQNGFRSGVTSILNRAYVLCRHAELDSPERQKIPAFSRLRLLQYTAAATHSFGRQRVCGALAAIRRLPRLLEIPCSERERLSECYLRLLQECGVD